MKLNKEGGNVYNIRGRNIHGAIGAMQSSGSKHKPFTTLSGHQELNWSSDIVSRFEKWDQNEITGSNTNSQEENFLEDGHNNLSQHG